jgi:hypothetical protein
VAVAVVTPIISGGDRDDAHLLYPLCQGSCPAP